MSEELATTDLDRTHEPPTALALIQTALQKGLATDQIRDLVELARQEKRDVAAEAYATAISNFQATCPPIIKNSRVMNKGGETVRYTFASWEDIAPVVNPHLAANRIAIAFSTPSGATEKLFALNLRIRVGIHVEEYPFSAPMPSLAPYTSGPLYMSEAQAFGAIKSYFKRYHFIDVLNLTVVGEDNDAALLGGVGDTLDEDEIVTVREMLKEKGGSESAFMAWVATFQPGAAKIEEIAKGFYDKIIDAIRRKPAPKPAAQGAKR